MSVIRAANVKCWFMAHDHLKRVYTLQPVGPTGCNNRLAQPVGCSVYTMQHVVPTGWLTVYTLQRRLSTALYNRGCTTGAPHPRQSHNDVFHSSHCRKMKCFCRKAIQMTSVGRVHRNMPSNIQRLLYTDENSNSPRLLSISLATAFHASLQIADNVSQYVVRFK